MENRIKDTSGYIKKKLVAKKEFLASYNTNNNKYEDAVVLEYINRINAHIVLLDMLVEESEDEEYIKENKNDIKKYFFEVSNFIKSIPKS